MKINYRTIFSSTLLVLLIIACWFFLMPLSGGIGKSFPYNSTAFFAWDDRFPELLLSKTYMPALRFGLLGLYIAPCYKGQIHNIPFFVFYVMPAFCLILIQAIRRMSMIRYVKPVMAWPRNCIVFPFSSLIMNRRVYKWLDEETLLLT